MRAVFYTFGCKANQYQTELLKSQFPNCQLVEFGQPAEVYVINTCTVTADADRKARQAIRRALTLAPRVILAGCYVRRQRAELQRSFPTIEFGEVEAFDSAVNLTPGRVRQNLMIQDGCENNCAYCIVPLVRGPVRSKPVEQVIAEARSLLQAGASEIILTGINLGTYQYDLAKLLPSLAGLPGLLRLRLSSLEPMYLTEQLLRTVASLSQVCRFLHIPVQSGSNKILQAMGRSYPAAEIVALVDRIRQVLPGCGLSTDLIVGLPGEGEAEFTETIKLVEACRFSRLHLFPYSPRPGTPAATWPDQVSASIKKARLQQLQTLRFKCLTTFAQQYLEKAVDILVEQIGEGLTANYIRVLYPGSEAEVGKIKTVRIKQVLPEHCLAEPLD